jgi:hypothetical protein
MEPAVASEETESAKALQHTMQRFWASVDPSTEGGEWLITVFKPYWDQLTEGMLSTFMSSRYLSGGSGKERAENMMAGYRKFYLELKRIKPPEELEAYHDKTLEEYAMSAKLDVRKPGAVEELGRIDKVGAEARSMLYEIFKRHNVPPEVPFAILPQ